MNAIKKVRELVDSHETNFRHVYKDVYGDAQHKAILELENIALTKIDKNINELSSLYISIVRAKEFTASERDFLSYPISGNTPLEDEEINQWISIMSKADAITYTTIYNQGLIARLNKLFTNEDAQMLLEDIKAERALILAQEDSGE